MVTEDRYRWAITDHACRACLGRVLERQAFDGRRTYRCSCCGIEREGRAPSVLCACGIRLRQGHGPQDGGIRCVVNTDRRPENMAEIVAMSVQDPRALQAGTDNPSP